MKYYEQIKAKDESKHFLTEKEFKAGKPGYLLIDDVTGKIRFYKDAKEETEEGTDAGERC